MLERPVCLGKEHWFHWPLLGSEAIWREWQVAVEPTQRGTDMSGNSQVDLLSVEMGTSGISHLDWLSVDGREWQLAWSCSARIGNRQVQKMMRLPSTKSWMCATLAGREWQLALGRAQRRLDASGDSL